MSEWPSGLRRQTQGVISFSVGEVSGLHMEAWVQIPLLTTCLLQLEALLRLHILSFLVFIMHLTSANDRISLTSIDPYVRMAERSKAPDSRCYLLLSW